MIFEFCFSNGHLSCKCLEIHVNTRIPERTIVSALMGVVDFTISGSWDVSYLHKQWNLQRRWSAVDLTLFTAEPILRALFDSGTSRIPLYIPRRPWTALDIKPYRPRPQKAACDWNWPWSKTPSSPLRLSRYDMPYNQCHYAPSRKHFCTTSVRYLSTAWNCLAYSSNKWVSRNALILRQEHVAVNKVQNNTNLVAYLSHLGLATFAVDKLAWGIVLTEHFSMTYILTIQSMYLYIFFLLVDFVTNKWFRNSGQPLACSARFSVSCVVHIVL